jgi:hypothetical protein
MTKESRTHATAATSGAAAAAAAAASSSPSTINQAILTDDQLRGKQNAAVSTTETLHSIISKNS